jgi:hypothetical protein
MITIERAKIMTSIYIEEKYAAEPCPRDLRRVLTGETHRNGI